MQTITLTGYPSGATDVYAYYVGQSLASYVADKVLFIEGTGPDTGLYTATVDESKGTSIVAFVGAAQPASWAEALVGVSWDLSNDAAEILTAFKADVDYGTADGGMVANAAAVASAATEARLAELDAANIPTDLTTVKAKTDLIGTIRSLIRW